LCFNWKCKIIQCWYFQKVVISTLTNLICTYEIWVSNSKIILSAILCLNYIPPKMTVDLRFMEIYFFPWCMLQIKLSWPWLEFFFQFCETIIWKIIQNIRKFALKKQIQNFWSQLLTKSWKKIGLALFNSEILHIWADYILNYSRSLQL
jgi:hypothetical protein